ncbi:HutD family protein [Variovorax sp. J22R133]|uniref:HutD/Ves family protein n=1 Tax=Variovorax brevis TaxID=3053503 RepID=UPI002575BCC4|nr:HutD family protein [Variovorax sp. J22R133]MDM0111618.1 HutD family protein [Variovorax sp. J22R133]
MTAHHRFSVASLPSTPWKNGGGTTREIACWPPGAGIEHFDWRVSIATIAASGPFSIFAGVDRTIMLLDGDGVRLHSNDHIDHRLDKPHEPFAFSGDVALDCTLLGGASSDFNVMSRRATCAADVRVIRSPQTLDAARDGLLMCLDGQWRAGDETLHKDEGLWWAQSPLAWTLEPLTAGATLVAVRWSHYPKKS